MITPLLKKPSLDKVKLSYYRPISNLSVVSNIIERIVKSRLTDRLTANRLFNHVQSAFLRQFLLAILVRWKSKIIIFDSHLTFEDQISSVSRACFCHIRDLRRVRSVINFNTAKTIGTSFVHSRLAFCNSLYYGLPKTQLNRLQHIQNSVARAVVAAPRSSDADLILKSLHWLRVPECIEYKIASITYKLLQHSSPQ